MNKFTRRLLRIVAFLALLYLALLIPFGEKGGSPANPGAKPFVWNNDSLWQQLEDRFRETAAWSPMRIDSAFQLLQTTMSGQLTALQNHTHGPSDTLWKQAEQTFFAMAPLVARQPGYTSAYLSANVRMRSLLKEKIKNWNVTDTTVKNLYYRIGYGMRMAVEEVLLQHNTPSFDPVLMVDTTPSVTPSASLFGIKVHSGDMFVSRGGAEVSALISRGNDYPGNFSHVALLYVEEGTHKPWLIEAHIEKGVAIASAEEYIKDKKLRFMVVRPRPDLPAMKTDPMLPHKASAYMYARVRERHIPYDFKMNFYDSTALFCSEVASFAYSRYGVQLWKSGSTISSPGVVNWLHSFGVEHFVTQMPSDLEYDPQLNVVAEWRDPGTLYKDHIDNAVMDAMLEMANNGKKIGYNRWELPIARVLKAYCVIKNTFGYAGIIPEGMSATTALRNQSFVAMHVNAKEKVMKEAEAFMKQHGYRAPYWQLVKFAEAALKEE